MRPDERRKQVEPIIDSTQDRFSASITVTCADNTGIAEMSFPSSPAARHAVPPSPATRQLTLEHHEYCPPNLSPFDTFANTPCTSLTQPDAAVVLETALLWVRPGHSNAVVRAGALAMQNGCARLLALDHGHLENLFSDANRWWSTDTPQFAKINEQCHVFVLV